MYELLSPYADNVCCVWVHLYWAFLCVCVLCAA